MREERFREAIKLRLLALVLAFALTWYALNPAPGPPRTDGRETDTPDEHRAEARNAIEANYHPALMEGGVGELSVVATSRAGEATDELEWPEVIDLL
jgi:hypothetical protein